MQIKNIKIFDSTSPANGSWTDISNLVQWSVSLTGVESNTYIEVSNDPYVNIDGSNALNAPSAASLSQTAYGPPVIQEASGSPAQTFYVQISYITKYGETLPSTEASLAVTAGNVLQVASPAQDAAGIAIGYNVYVGLTSGAETLQTMPQYVPAWKVDSTPGIHWSGSGAIPIGQMFTLVSFVNSNVLPPVSSTAGGPNSGTDITGDLSTVVAPAAATGEIFIVSTGTAAIVAPSCLVWKWLRVIKTTGSSSETVAWLMGQNG